MATHKGELAYIDLVTKVIKEGEKRDTRNSVTYSLFGESLEYNLYDLDKNETLLPLMVTKKMSFKNIFEELMFFLRGDTDTKELESKGVNIWKGNTNTQFLESRNLDYTQGDMGPMYGFQWNHFGAEYDGCDKDYSNQGFNQIDDCIRLIKTDPTSRRIMFTALNPSVAHKMVLHPCHVLFQFYVRTDLSGRKFLDGQLYQRSADLMLGVPYNIVSYSMLIIIFAHHCSLKPGKLRLVFGDVHIYDTHIPGALEQIRRTPTGDHPTIHVSNTREDVRDYEQLDFRIFYQAQPNIKMKMVA